MSEHHSTPLEFTLVTDGQPGPIEDSKVVMLFVNGKQVASGIYDDRPGVFPDHAVAQDLLKTWLHA